MDIKQAVAELLEILKNGVVEGKELITTQFYILCQQIIRWGIWSNICGGILCIVILCIGYYLQRLALKKDDGDPKWIFLRVNCVIAMVFAGISLIICVYNLIKVLSAPGLYILEHLK
jgi:hypothetical protein